ncbi:MAG: hypothetical protein ACYTGX_17430 [Planctomycetota bacterium]
MVRPAGDESGGLEGGLAAESGGDPAADGTGEAAGAAGAQVGTPGAAGGDGAGEGSADGGADGAGDTAGTGSGDDDNADTDNAAGEDDGYMLSGKSARKRPWFIVVDAESGAPLAGAIVYLAPLENREAGTWSMQPAGTSDSQGRVSQRYARTWAGRWTKLGPLGVCAALHTRVGGVARIGRKRPAAAGRGGQHHPRAGHRSRQRETAAGGGGRGAAAARPVVE